MCRWCILLVTRVCSLLHGSSQTVLTVKVINVDLRKWECLENYKCIILSSSEIKDSLLKKKKKKHHVDTLNGAEDNRRDLSACVLKWSIVPSCAGSYYLLKLKLQYSFHLVKPFSSGSSRQARAVNTQR